MKSLLLVGGLLGWSLGMGFSVLQGDSWPECLWHGGLAAYLTALLMRWWGRAWRKSLEQSVQERDEAEDAILPAASTPNTSRS
jgi:hypothetical protein